MGELKELEEITNLNPEHLRFCLQNLGRYMPYEGTGLPAEEAIPLVIDHISSVYGYEHDNLPNIPVIRPVICLIRSQIWTLLDHLFRSEEWKNKVMLTSNYKCALYQTEFYYRRQISSFQI